LYFSAGPEEQREQFRISLLRMHQPIGSTHCAGLRSERAVKAETPNKISALDVRRRTRVSNAVRSMKKCLIVFFLIASSAAVQAKDFRVVDRGESCDHVIEGEEALGSTFTGIAEEKSVFPFRGLVREWPATIAYFCGEGKFRSGLYFLDRTSLSEAKAAYAELKNLLTLEYGKPTTDLASSEMQRKLEGSSSRPFSEQTDICIWEKETVVIQLSIDGPFGEQWQTGLSFRTFGGI
jgi:hypothetical protein